MEKGFRLVKCPCCSVKLRLAISEKQYGKILEVTCPKCKTKCRVKIPVPAKETVESPKPEFPFSEDIFGDLFKMSNK